MQGNLVLSAGAVWIVGRSGFIRVQGCLTVEEGAEVRKFNPVLPLIQAQIRVLGGTRESFMDVQCLQIFGKIAVTGDEEHAAECLELEETTAEGPTGGTTLGFVPKAFPCTKGELAGLLVRLRSFPAWQ